MWRHGSWRSTEGRKNDEGKQIWISKLTFLRDDYCGSKHILKREVVYIWSVRLPLRNDMNFASSSKTLLILRVTTLKIQSLVFTWYGVDKFTVNCLMVSSTSSCMMGSRATFPKPIPRRVVWAKWRCFAHPSVQPDTKIPECKKINTFIRLLNFGLWTYL